MVSLMPDLVMQLLLMVLEAVLAGTVLLVLFNARRVIGLASVYATVGVFYYLATFLSGAIFIKVSPDLLMSPGSVALFPASLFAVLLVYIREDTKEARNMISSLLAANVSAGLLGLLVIQHLSNPLAVNPHALPPELFAQSPRLFLIGTLTLVIDTILIPIVYEAVSRILKSLFMRIYVSLALVLAFDTLLFVTGGFFESPFYQQILLSGILGKVAIALVYAAMLTLYLQRSNAATSTHPDLRHLFQVLTYRQKYEALRAQAVRDPLTGAYNRGFFDEILRSQIATTVRSGSLVSLMIIDLDNFKNINDTLGHSEGDRALKAIVRAISATARSSDFVCRYGGDEFCLILPATSRHSAEQLAARMSEEISAACARENVGGSLPVTATIGIAECPVDGLDVAELMRIADQRLYRGKAEGRNRFVAT